MAHHLIASNATIKAVKPGDARSRLTDGAGLYLRLFVKGGSHGWRFDYSLNGRRNTLSLGTYPSTGLSLARNLRPEIWPRRVELPNRVFQQNRPRIAVGMRVTGHPPHRSERARFEHSAPTLGA